MLTHANWAAMMRNSMAELSPIDETDTVLHVAPLSHFSGYVGPTYSARGASHFVVDRFDPEGALQLIDREAITTVPLVPTMLGDLVLAAEETLVDASSLRTIVYGGSAIAPSRLARAIKIFGLVFVQFYGLSEMPMPLTALRARDHDFDLSLPPPPRLASAGRVNPYVELKLICPGGNEEVATGEVGEIVVRGDTVMRGYWGNAQATSETIDADGWAATGDLGVLSQDGFLTIVDRRKDMIVSGGFNVYPAEIEHVIETLRPVREVAVIGVPDERLGEAVKAVVVTRPGQEVTATEVMDACAAQLARYKVPRSIDFVDSLPKTGSGKIMRRALRHRYWEQRERQIGA
jgi:acyl-CoA synthetase (AMP-forming)/AMP-acid ligase II